MNIHTIIIAVATIYIIFLLYDLIDGRDTYPSGVDSHQYTVADLKNAQQAATYIGRLNNKIITFLRWLKFKWGSRLADSDRAPNVINRILKLYNPEAITETDPRVDKNTSYTINKGESLYLCLRSKTPPYEFADQNTMMFVLLHEISHMGNNTWGHDEAFWEVFKFVLLEAAEAGIYVPIDYMQRPVMYCGMKIDYNPLFDSSVDSI